MQCNAVLAAEASVYRLTCIAMPCGHAMQNDRSSVHGTGHMARRHWLLSGYQFTDDTEFHGTETAVVMIFILLLFHLFRTTSAFSLWQ